MTRDPVFLVLLRHALALAAAGLVGWVVIRGLVLVALDAIARYAP